MHLPCTSETTRRQTSNKSSVHPIQYNSLPIVGLCLDKPRHWTASDLRITESRQQAHHSAQPPQQKASL